MAFELTAVLAAEDDSDKDDAARDADGGIELGLAGMASISSTVDFIFVVTADGESVAVKAAVRAAVGPVLGRGLGT